MLLQGGDQRKEQILRATGMGTGHARESINPRWAAARSGALSPLFSVLCLPKTPTRGAFRGEIIATSPNRVKLGKPPVPGCPL
jgi:hypothetical protein